MLAAGAQVSARKLGQHMTFLFQSLSPLLMHETWCCTEQVYNYPITLGCLIYKRPSFHVNPTTGPCHQGRKRVPRSSCHGTPSRTCGMIEPRRGSNDKYPVRQEPELAHDERGLHLRLFLRLLLFLYALACLFLLQRGLGPPLPLPSAFTPFWALNADRFCETLLSCGKFLGANLLSLFVAFSQRIHRRSE